MSSSVIVLEPGYSRWKCKPTSMFANGTSTLVFAEQQKIIVDTLGPWDRNKLVQHLNSKNVIAEDIDLLIGTHLHTDHIGNLNLFTNCSQIVGDQRSHQDLFEFDIFEPNKPIHLNKNVDLFFTPGHTNNDVSVVVYNVEQLGTVAITGDLFESEFDIEDDNLWKEAGSVDHELQLRNRQLIMSMADYIVPGHGNMFKVNH